MHRVETCVLDTILGEGGARGRVQAQVGEAARLGPTAAYQKKKSVGSHRRQSRPRVNHRLLRFTT